MVGEGDLIVPLPPTQLFQAVIQKSFKQRKGNVQGEVEVIMKSQKRNREKLASVEWEHDTYHQDNEKIYFYCPCCNDLLDVFSTDELNEELNEELDCNEFSNETISQFAYERMGWVNYCCHCGQHLDWKHCKNW